MRREGGVIALRACRLEDTTDLIVRLALEQALRQTPRRLALWRIRALDHFLRQVEEIRLEGEGSLPNELWQDLLAFAARHEPGLLGAVRGNSPGKLDSIHDALFDAQGRVMVTLAAPEVLESQAA